MQVQEVAERLLFRGCGATTAILLRCQPIELSQTGNMIRMDTPNDVRNKTAWHQEMQFVYNPGLVLWIPLVEITDNIGPLHILEKSHLDGEIVVERNEIRDYTTSRVSKCEIPEKILSAIRLSFIVGDINLILLRSQGVSW